MSSRKYHQKSRSGCIQCKKRRVKCDETRPVCRSCQRTQATCSYLNDDSSTAHSPGSSSVVSSPRHVSVQETITARSDPFSFDLLDLGLMHHFTLVVSLDLFPKGHGSTIWQRTIPVAAQSHPMLMHGLLAISAAHLSLTEDKSKYTTRALHHQNLGLLKYRSAIGGISRDNAVASFVFSVMLGVLTFVSPRLTETAPSIDEALDLFTLMRGSKIIWDLEKETVLTSTMAGLIPAPDWAYDKLDPEIEGRFDDLKKRVPEDQSYAAAVDTLKLCLRVAIAAPDDLLVAPRWAATVDDAFWARLKAHEPWALLLLAYQSMVLSTYQQIWWLKDWGQGLIKAVSNTLSEADKEVVDWDHRVEFLLQYSDRAQKRG